MTRLLLFLPALMLGGCGTTASGSFTADGVATPPPAHVLGTVSLTAAGGTVSTKPKFVGTERGRARFSAQFRGDAMQRRITSLVKSDNSGPGVFAAVISVGCDVPSGADILYGRGGTYEVVAKEVASPKAECLAAVTTVAVVELPTSSN